MKINWQLCFHWLIFLFFLSFFLWGKQQDRLIVSNKRINQHPNVLIEQTIDLSLMISALYNYYDDDQIDKAFFLAKKLIVNYPLNADAYFVFGDINLKQKNYSTALDYLSIAEKNKHNFFYKIQELELYLSLGTLYYFQKNYPLQKKYFWQVLQEVDKSKFMLAKIEQNYYSAHAYFFLGLQKLQQDDFFRALSHFEKNIKLNYYQKISYFLLAYYLASKDIDTINMSVERNQKGFLIEEDDREKYFLDYYQRYSEYTQYNQQYQYLMPPQKQALIDEYYESISIK